MEHKGEVEGREEQPLSASCRLIRISQHHLVEFPLPERWTTTNLTWGG